MKAIIYHNHDDYELAGSGAIQPCQTLTAILLKCPGCGRSSSMTVYEVGKQKPPSPSWEISGLPDNTTLKPSINCIGCCGWHGWLTNGKYVHC